MTKTFRDNCDKNIVLQTSCEPHSRCSNAVNKVLFRSFCTPMYAWAVSFRLRCCRGCDLSAVQPLQALSCEPITRPSDRITASHPLSHAPAYMHHNHGGISESHACKDCVWPIILDSELYTTCPGERGLEVMTHQVQYNIPTFEAALRKNMHLFLERCRRSNNVMVACFDAVRLFVFLLIL